MSRGYKPRGLAGSSLAPLLDVILVLVLMLVFVVAVLLVNVNDPPKGETVESSDVTPSAIFVQVSWTDGQPHDIDTYLKCTEYLVGKEVVTSVSYRQKHANFLDLFPDDLGRPSFENYERVMANSMRERLLPNTFCQLNAHLYNVHGGELPVEGLVHVILNKDDPALEFALTPKTGLSYELSKHGAEVTLMTLVIGDDGTILREATGTYPDTPFVCLATCK